MANQGKHEGECLENDAVCDDCLDARLNRSFDNGIRVGNDNMQKRVVIHLKTLAGEAFVRGDDDRSQTAARTLKQLALEIEKWSRE